MLVYSEGDKFKDRVTFLTKTFLRYPCAYRLIDSILALYPGVAIIVADDNPAEYFQEIDATKYPTVKQYKMPLEEGFFAGRALAVSQVRTGKTLRMYSEVQIFRILCLDGRRLLVGQ